MQIHFVCPLGSLGLKNFKGVYARVWFNIAASDHLSYRFIFDKNYSVTLPRRKSVCLRWSRDQAQPAYFSQRQREAEEKEPGTRLVPKELYVIAFN